MKKIFKQRDCLSQEEIKRYLQEDWSRKEAHDVENHLLDCPFCRDAMEGYANTQNFEAAEQVLEEASPKLEVQPDDKVVQMQPRPPRRMFLRIAAAILLLLLPLSAILYWGAGNENRHYADYIDAIEVKSSELAMRGNPDTVKKAEVFYQGLQAFDAKNYQKSVTCFNTALRDKPDDLQIAFFSGLAHLKAGQTDEAIPLLEKVLKNKNSGYETDAAWYLALAYVKKGDTSRVKSLLTLVLASDNYYNQKAAELIGKL